GISLTCDCLLKTEWRDAASFGDTTQISGDSNGTGHCGQRVALATRPCAAARRWRAGARICRDLSLVRLAAADHGRTPRPGCADRFLDPHLQHLAAHRA